jgi:hypothetical protein
MLKFTPQELKRVIEVEDDFGHEMRIREILKAETSLAIEHGGVYTDPVERKSRDYDFRCELAQ